jgi:radical SAM protein with 4Fe4S-binding SPASM domain
VIENLKKIIAIKNKKNINKPRIFWKFMINKFNQDQLEEAKAWARKLGVEFETTTISVSEGSPEFRFPGTIKERIEKWVPSDEKKSKTRYHEKIRYPLFNRKCDQLFSTLAISPTGKILPCCFVSNNESSFGDISKESFRKIWNNKKYKYARNLFINNKKENKPKESVICDKCKYFEKNN